MLLELKKFGAEGVPPSAIVTMRDAVTSPTMPRSHFDNVDRRQVVPAEAVQVYPAITTTRSAPLPGRFSAPSRSQSGRAVDEEQRRERQRRILRHNSGAQSMSALDTSDDDRPASSESRGFLRRRSRDLTNFFRGLGRASRGPKMTSQKREEIRGYKASCGGTRTRPYRRISRRSIPMTGMIVMMSACSGSRTWCLASKEPRDRSS